MESNHLINESSPYLLQHAHNPVDWYPWGEKAFARAKSEDKAILLSVGYATCHWCHVMAHESFEDPATAALMNHHFINIKLDREERPDIDSIYMNALQAMRGAGGWPMTIVMTPEGVPFFAGTYFPKEARYGQPAFTTVLQSLAKAWQNDRATIVQSAQVLHQQLKDMMEAGFRPHEDEPQQAWLEQALKQLEQHFDSQNGGFGDAPKFPPHGILKFLLTQEKNYSSMAHYSLERMAQGGIYDQLGGGFCRYSVDRYWRVPHFEKMLYDNAQLLSQYSRAYQQQAKPRYREVVAETVAWLNREMRHDEGGFFCALDADSDGVEGKFYRWQDEELDELLGEADAKLIKAYFEVTMMGNFEGYNVLNTPHSKGEVAQRFGMTPQNLERKLVYAKQVLFEARATREKPARDDKILCSWNGLLLQGLAEAGRIFQREDWLSEASELAAFMQKTFYREGRLYHVYTPTGELKVLGLLEDYAYSIIGLVSLYQSSYESRWLLWALELAEQMITFFYDSEAGNFYSTPHDGETLIVRPKDFFDQALPSDNAAAAEALLYLARYTGNSTWDAMAKSCIQSIREVLPRSPLAFGEMLHVLDFWLTAPKEVLLLVKEREMARAYLQLLHKDAHPHTISAVLTPEDVLGEQISFAQQISFARGRSHDAEHDVTVYVCQNGVCQLPVYTLEDFATQLRQLAIANA